MSKKILTLGGFNAQRRSGVFTAAWVGWGRTELPHSRVQPIDEKQSEEALRKSRHIVVAFEGKSKSKNMTIGTLYAGEEFKFFSEKAQGFVVTNPDWRPFFAKLLEFDPSDAGPASTP